MQRLLVIAPVWGELNEHTLPDLLPELSGRANLPLQSRPAFNYVQKSDQLAQEVIVSRGTEGLVPPDPRCMRGHDSLSERFLASLPD